MAMVRDILAGLWATVGLPSPSLQHVDLTGAEPALPSSFRVGAAAQATIAAVTLAAAEIDHLRNGRRQHASVDMRHAAVEFRSERYLRLAGKAPQIWDDLSGAYRCRDGRWLRLHMLLPHHRRGALDLLGCDASREAIAQALRDRDAAEFEAEAADRGLVAAMMRSFAEWDAHPEGDAVSMRPVVTLEKIGEAPPQALAPGERPLSAVKVLDLTRIIAGPLCGRVLAAHGADVLYITAPHLPFSFPFVIDFGRGKLSAQLDLREEAGLDNLRRLVAGADIFVQSYRPGSLAARGFAPAELARIRPGIVLVSLSAYSLDGPWRGRRGFDSLVQTATGFNHAEAEAKGVDEPLPLPCQSLDHGAGYLMALGALAALHRRATEGGSWHVRVSLAGTGHWLRGLGRLPNGFSAPDPGLDDCLDLVERTDSGFGPLTTVRHSGRLSETPPFWSRPAVPLGADRARWPEGGS